MHVSPNPITKATMLLFIMHRPEVVVIVVIRMPGILRDFVPVMVQRHMVAFMVVLLLQQQQQQQQPSLIRPPMIMLLGKTNVRLRLIKSSA
jgi:hypothetical protein